jgi:hypothetical protein
MIKSALQSSLTNDIKYDSMSVGNLPSSEYLIQTVEVGATPIGAITFDVSSFSGIYKHLQLVMVVRDRNANSSARTELEFNGSATGYASHELRSTGSAIGAESFTNGSFARPGRIIGGSGIANSFSALIVDILDPFSPNKNTTIKTLGGSTGYNYVYLTSSFWNTTNLVTSIKLQPEAGVAEWAQGSRISLYGVTA